MKIVVLGGGISTERDVSLSSSRMIYEALKKKGHQVVLLDVYLGYEGSSGDVENIFEKDCNWAENIGGIRESNPDLSAIKAMRKDGGRSYFGPNVLNICSRADVVFLGLHGEDGENGKVQAAFDLLGIRYTGTDYVSSALSMDKSLSKELFAYHHIPTPAGVHIRKKDAGQQKSPVALPCVVKACRGGSSVGVSIAHSEEEYRKALEEAFLYDDEAVVEQYIEGREFSCAVIDGKALPVIEIAPLHGFYDYKNKYQAGSTVETCPADLPEEKAKEIQEISEKVFEVLRLKNYARMDFMMGKDGSVYCLEANTLPGMTPTSLIPQEAQAIGVGFEDLCEWILKLAFRG
ncbi:MAG TPA: D-alanine--D-alanine ligase [Candidatus Eisenbergiella merdipullorum]|uniref:D-alanine--D-alanine ligase n=1 Tax=Candidatus Eisenbergiella merdipullorum TaxID=2838553 RepID=A0A9D2I5H3_9FIRM|nr:D-alanine--D-alanine ligase [Candidatus Eisenbergiella merdipullorum]